MLFKKHAARLCRLFAAVRNEQCSFRRRSLALCLLARRCVFFRSQSPAFSHIPVSSFLRFLLETGPLLSKMSNNPMVMFCQQYPRYRSCVSFFTGMLAYFDVSKISIPFTILFTLADNESVSIDDILAAQHGHHFFSEGNVVPRRFLADLLEYNRLWI